jgi:hypothetical protein
MTEVLVSHCAFHTSSSQSPKVFSYGRPSVWTIPHSIFNKSKRNSQQQQTSHWNSSIPTQQILSNSTMNSVTINLQEPDKVEATPITTQRKQPYTHRHWWEDFRESVSLRRNSNISPVQQQCWNDFKHDMYLHTTASSKRDPYGFTSAGPSREPTPNVEKCWEDFKHNVALKAGKTLEKDPYGFSSEAPSRAHTPALPTNLSGEESQQRD